TEVSRVRAALCPWNNTISRREPCPEPETDTLRWYQRIACIRKQIIPVRTLGLKEEGAKRG
ncbi:MAG: hypothetical protein D6736_01305, partial [Nitrospinota bacterium]